MPIGMETAYGNDRTVPSSLRPAPSPGRVALLGNRCEGVGWVPAQKRLCAGPNLALPCSGAPFRPIGQSGSAHEPAGGVLRRRPCSERVSCACVRACVRACGQAVLDGSLRQAVPGHPRHVRAATTYSSCQATAAKPCPAQRGRGLALVTLAAPPLTRALGKRRDANAKQTKGRAGPSPGHGGCSHLEHTLARFLKELRFCGRTQDTLLSLSLS